MVWDIETGKGGVYPMKICVPGAMNSRGVAHPGMAY